MTPEDFIAHWKDNPLTERAGAQAWFCDLCDLLGVDKPRDSENYCFERGAKKTGGGDPLRPRSGQGWADIWKRAFFGWENKKPGKDLQEALKQLLDYSLNLENPPLLVVSDRERIIIHTTFPFPAGLTPADTRPNPETVGWAKQRVPINDATADPDGSALSHRASLTGTEADGHAALCPSYNLPMLADPSRLPFAEAIAQAAFELNRLREAWLNPPDWVDWLITPEEEQAGFPPRPVAKPGHEADLKKRTLTNLYNARPAWLSMAHERLDQAVAAAYGWEDYTPDMPDEEILKRLLALNQARAAKP